MLLIISKYTYQLYQDDIEKFGQTSDVCPDPPKCVLSVHASANAVPVLNYGVPLEGMAKPVILSIHRMLTITPLTTSGKLSHIK